MEVPPRGAAAMHVEGTVLIDGAAQRRGELLRQPGVEARLLHIRSYYAGHWQGRIAPVAERTAG